MLLTILAVLAVIILLIIAAVAYYVIRNHIRNNTRARIFVFFTNDSSKYAIFPRALTVLSIIRIGNTAVLANVDGVTPRMFGGDIITVINTPRAAVDTSGVPTTAYLIPAHYANGKITPIAGSPRIIASRQPDGFAHIHSSTSYTSDEAEWKVHRVDASNISTSKSALVRYPYGANYPAWFHRDVLAPSGGTSFRARFVNVKYPKMETPIISLIRYPDGLFSSYSQTDKVIIVPTKSPGLCRIISINDSEVNTRTGKIAGLRALTAISNTSLAMQQSDDDIELSDALSAKSPESLWKLILE